MVTTHADIVTARTYAEYALCYFVRPHAEAWDWASTAFDKLRPAKCTALRLTES